MQLLEAPLAIVDVETTGANPARDRVTEIAVLEDAARPRFDLEQYRILARHLGARRARIVELPYPAT